MSNQSPEELARVVKENTKPEMIKIDRGSENERNILLYPKGMEIKSLKPLLDEYREKPERRSGTIKVDRLESFVELANRFKNGDSVLFARAVIKENSIDAHLQAVLDYHPATADVTEAENAKHRVRFDFPTSKDFDFWMEQNGKVMSQADFAIFLEERVIDMASPQQEDIDRIQGLRPKFAEPLEMLELSRNLELYSTGSLVSKNKLSSGETELKFKSEHIDASGKPVTLPDFFVVRLPIFEGGNVERVLVRLRYRLGQGSVVWFYDLYRIDNVLQKAFELDCETAESNTELPLYFGAPEA